MRPPAAACVVLLLLVGSFAGCFGETEDEDGLSLEVEREGWEVRVVRADGEMHTYSVKSSPYEGDADGDDLDDFQERLHGSDPDAADTDQDGLLDGPNVWLDADHSRAVAWREAGIVHRTGADGRLVFVGERGDAEQGVGGDLLDADTDDDGLLDGVEVGGYEMTILGERRTVFTLAWAEDTDGDNIFDDVERGLGLDPSRPDTDGDGVPDGTDLDPFGDLVLGFDVQRLFLEGSGTTSLWVHAALASVPYRSPTVAIPRGEEWTGSAFESGDLDVPDGGADHRRGNHNASFSVTFISGDGDQAQTLDVFSTTTGEPTLFGVLDVRTGALHLRDAPGSTWPDRFEGPDGWVEPVIRIVGGPWGAST